MNFKNFFLIKMVNLKKNIFRRRLLLTFVFPIKHVERNFYPLKHDRVGFAAKQHILLQLRNSHLQAERFTSIALNWQRRWVEACNNIKGNGGRNHANTPRPPQLHDLPLLDALCLASPKTHSCSIVKYHPLKRWPAWKLRKFASSHALPLNE